MYQPGVRNETVLAEIRFCQLREFLESRQPFIGNLCLRQSQLLQPGKLSEHDDGLVTRQCPCQVDLFQFGQAIQLLKAHLADKEKIQ